jgi:hypothetical protein
MRLRGEAELEASPSSRWATKADAEYRSAAEGTAPKWRANRQAVQLGEQPRLGLRAREQRFLGVVDRSFGGVQRPCPRQVDESLHWSTGLCGE